MAKSNEYFFQEHWDLPGVAPSQVYSVLSRSRLLPDWWKGVYLEAEPLDGDVPKVGARTRVVARGFLPYKLRFVLEATCLEQDKVVETKASGDFDGLWRAEISESDGGTRVDISWTTTVNKPVVRFLSPVLAPLFKKNHDWTTVRGEAGLREYLSSQPGQSSSVT